MAVSKSCPCHVSMMRMSVPQDQMSPMLMMHDAGVGLRLRRLSEAEPPPDRCVPDTSLTGAGAVSPPLTSERASSSSASVSLASPDLGVTQLTSRRQRSARSPVGASLQEMYGLVSNRAKDPNDKVSRMQIMI